MAIHESSPTYTCGDETLHLIKKSERSAIVCAQLSQHAPVRAVMEGGSAFNWVTLDTESCPVSPRSRHHYRLMRLPLRRDSTERKRRDAGVDLLISRACAQ